jgi:hypothetical protein
MAVVLQGLEGIAAAQTRIAGWIARVSINGR